MYTVEFGDGTIMTGLYAWGWDFARKSPFDEGFFTPARLHSVKVTYTPSGDEKDYEETLDELGGKHPLLGEHDAVLFRGVSVYPVNGDYYLSLRVPDVKDTAQARIEGDIAYIAMMTGVEL